MPYLHPVGAGRLAVRATPATPQPYLKCQQLVGVGPWAAPRNVARHPAGAIGDDALVLEYVPVLHAEGSGGAGSWRVHSGTGHGGTLRVQHPYRGAACLFQGARLVDPAVITACRTGSSKQRPNQTKVSTSCSLALPSAARWAVGGCSTRDCSTHLLARRSRSKHCSRCAACMPSSRQQGCPACSCRQPA